ncbi:MAG: hydantoinase B/oxoprolinase family protein [Acidimicrobiia bacterium]
MTMTPAQLAVLLARLNGIAEQMGIVLRRSAYSPNIKERADSSAALFTASGEVVAQAAHIPVHLGAMPASVVAAITALPDPRPDDHVVVNDPFAGGTHLNDVTLVTPVFVDEVLAGWVATRAHHADVGGSAPGSMPADAREIFAEGLRIPPVRLTPEVRALFLANTRTPGERAGDLDAQLGANRVGAATFASLMSTGIDVREAIAYGERRMRAAVAAIDDGEYRFVDRLDSGTAIRVCVRVAGDEIEFDFTGTDPQSPGNVNAVEAVTVSAVGFAVRAAIDPGAPANGGALRPVRVIAPRGSVVAADAPAAVAAGNVEVSQRIADVCLGALAQALPDRVGAASQGTMNNLLLGGRGWAYYETVGGGQGARPGRDGMSGVHTVMTNTQNTPIEALERAYPVRVRRLRLRTGSGGEGQWRGGDGIERDIELLEPTTVTLITERRVTAPWGLDGGDDGATGENWLLPGGDEGRAKQLPYSVTFDGVAGDIVRVRTPGGGGWGKGH